MRRYVSAAVAVANRQRYRGGTPYIYAAGVWNGGESRADLTQGVNALTDIQLMSASLIGHSGSSTFRLSTSAVSMSHAGSRFSSESARRPSMMGFEDEVEQSFGRPCRQCDSRSKRTYELTSSIVPRGTSFHR